VNKHGVILCPQGVEDVYKIVDIEQVPLPLFGRRVALLEQRVANPLVGSRLVQQRATCHLQTILTKVDIFSEFITGHRPRDSLKAREKFLQYIFYALDVGHCCEPPGTGLAVPSGEFFDELCCQGADSPFVGTLRRARPGST